MLPFATSYIGVLSVAKKYTTIKANIDIAPINRLLMLFIFVFTKGIVIVNNSAVTRRIA